jgi:carbonic anhydrase
VPVLPFLPRQALDIVICIDCRVDPAQIPGIEMGDALVQWNIGGWVTPAVIRDIADAAYGSVNHLLRHGMSHLGFPCLHQS